MTDLATARASKPSAGRFWSHVQKTDGCWLWMGARLPAGYGRFAVRRHPVPATHVAWFLTHGQWPEAYVLHHCDNPPCVRPDHLFAGDAAANARDRDAKGRGTPLPHLAGEANGRAKLTSAQVAEVRRRYMEPNPPPHGVLAGELGVSRSLIQQIVGGQIWHGVGENA